MRAGAGPVRVALAGAGMISQEYLRTLTGSADVEVVAIGSRSPERARARAAEWGVRRAGRLDDVLALEDVELVVDLTVPAARAATTEAALEAGKHVWCEKPLGLDRASAARLLAVAEQRGLQLGVAPDTVLGGAWQAAIGAVRGGAIGTPLTAVTAAHWQGPDAVHPDPAFLFAAGGGPLHDLGPYFFTALVHLLGPIVQVAATGTRSRTVREVRVGPRAGTSFPVEVPTHVSVLSIFAGGGRAQSLFSADTALFRHGVVEVHGTEGTAVLPDPNRFDAPDGLRIARPLTRIEPPVQQPLERLPLPERREGRGLGVLLMARSILAGEKAGATAPVARHVQDVLQSAAESIAEERFVDVVSAVDPLLPGPVSAADPRAHHEGSGPDPVG